MKENLNNLDLHDCEFMKIGEDTYEYRYVPVQVKYAKHSNNERCFQPIENPHYCYKSYPNVQHCLDIAFEVMVASKV